MLKKSNQLEEDNGLLQQQLITTLEELRVHEQTKVMLEMIHLAKLVEKEVKWAWKIIYEKWLTKPFAKKRKHLSQIKWNSGYGKHTRIEKLTGLLQAEIEVATVIPTILTRTQKESMLQVPSIQQPLLNATNGFLCEVHKKCFLCVINLASHRRGSLKLGRHLRRGWN